MTRILIIEDDIEIRESIADLLFMNGYETSTAPCGRTGIEKAFADSHDLIISDIMMPDVDGFAVYQALRADPRTAVVPFIFLTARTDRTDVRRSMGMGADDYITKPFEQKELLDSIKARLERRQIAVSAMDELRNSLSRSLSHEFRTPLNGILGFCNIILESIRDKQPVNTKDLANHIGFIRESGERLFTLVRKYELFTGIRIHTADPQILAGWRKSIAIRWKDELETDLIKIAQQFRCVPDLESITSLPNVPLKIPENLLRCALSELMDNAYKFSSRETPVTITGVIEASNYIFTIQDHGCGMTPHQIAKIDSYIQFDRQAKEQQGLGLGLAIVKLIAKVTDCRFVIESEKSRGTTVKLIVPIAKNSTTQQ
ncbi:MAG: response regulator [Candidatus Riflebacteria bacterium]|nr:response regulator [Candidatus Riflebacteria bacterium]